MLGTSELEHLEGVQAVSTLSSSLPASGGGLADRQSSLPHRLRQQQDERVTRS